MIGSVGTGSQSVVQSTKVLCAQCRVPIEWLTEPNPKDWVCCPRCGTGDHFEAVMAEAKDYIREMAAKSLNEMFDSAITKSDTISLKAIYSPSGRQWRFIADVEF